MRNSQKWTTRKVLQEVTQIIWDERTMSHRSHIEAVNKTLKEKLKTNKRAHLGGGGYNFSGQLLKLGDGKMPEQNGIGKTVTTLNGLILNIYPGIGNIFEKKLHLHLRKGYRLQKILLLTKLTMKFKKESIW